MRRGLVPINPNEYEFDFAQSDNVLGTFCLAGSKGSEAKAFGKYFIGDEKIARCFGQVLDSLLADWVDVALYVYLADRLSPRRRRTSPHHHFQWSRKLRLKIPVRRPDVWRSERIHSALLRLLRFFTEDQWQIEFIQSQKEKRQSESQTFLFEASKPELLKVALYSGGLDSFAGAVQKVAEMPDYHFVLVSGVTNSRQGKLQREQINIIKDFAPDRITHVSVPYGLQRGIERSEENTQRSRGFLFMTIGAVTAIAAEANELQIYENGIGAINLPYDATQVGTSNTRSVHPVALLRMSQFITELTGIAFSINDPFVFKTKAEMCSHSEVQRLGQYVNSTFSCDSFPIRKRAQSQCGICTSCLLRRQSLELAGLSMFDAPAGYLSDLLSTNSSFGSKQIRWLSVMEWQAQKITTCLASEDSWQLLVQDFPSLMEIVSEVCLATGASPQEIKSSLLRLYSRYVKQWNDFSARRLINCQTIAA